MKRFSSRCASAIQIVRPSKSIAETQAPTSLAQIIADYLAPHESDTFSRRS
jgi:hypothetical protein